MEDRATFLTHSLVRNIYPSVLYFPRKGYSSHISEDGFALITLNLLLLSPK